MQFAFSNRPKIGGFPYLAECLKQAGVTKNVWFLPSANCLYYINKDLLANQGQPLIKQLTTVPIFDKDALIEAIRTDQSGKSTFPEFLTSIWNAGVITYVVDFTNRTTTYLGSHNESYCEDYPAVVVTGLEF